jgi:ankyrin repeat protein
MGDIWKAAMDGDVGTLEFLVGQDPRLLEAPDLGMTPLMYASAGGRVEVVRCLMDQGAAINKWSSQGWCALSLAIDHSRPAVVRLLVERGADPTSATNKGSTPLIAASSKGQLETVRVLLGHPSVKATINRRKDDGDTALWSACFWGRGGVVRALLENGADPTIASANGTTPMAAAKQDPDIRFPGATAEGRRDCVVALRVRGCLAQTIMTHLLDLMTDGGVGCCSVL